MEKIQYFDEITRNYDGTYNVVYYCIQQDCTTEETIRVLPTEYAVFNQESMKWEYVNAA